VGDKFAAPGGLIWGERLGQLSKPRFEDKTKLEGRETRQSGNMLFALNETVLGIGSPKPAQGKVSSKKEHAHGRKLKKE